MGEKKIKPGKPTQKGPGMSSLLKPYRGRIFLLIFFALLSNGINLILPRIIASGIDAYPSHYDLKKILIEFLVGSLHHFYFYFSAKYHSNEYCGTGSQRSAFKAVFQNIHSELCIY